jgi:rare lipoprotein A
MNDELAIYISVLIAATALAILVIFSADAEANSCIDGHASYYERCFGTCETASGDWFEPDGISVAHKTLPFGTVLRITNKHNGATVEAEVNDRGPFVAGRALDLSRGAMREIGGLGAGVIPVTYCIVGEG